MELFITLALPLTLLVSLILGIRARARGGSVWRHLLWGLCIGAWLALLIIGFVFLTQSASLELGALVLGGIATILAPIAIISSLVLHATKQPVGQTPA